MQTFTLFAVLIGSAMVLAGLLLASRAPALTPVRVKAQPWRRR